MKLISLNIWGGRLYEPLVEFVKKHRDSADVFCFQEVLASARSDIETSNGNRVHILDELAAALPDFSYAFHVDEEGADSAGPVDFDLKDGQATFLKKPLPMISSGEIPLFSGDAENSELFHKKTFRPKNFGYIRIPWKKKTLTVANVHAFTFRGDNKLDMPERIEQSRRIKEFLANERGSIVLCGDFNLFPDTESIRMLENPLVNLITQYGIARTRSTISPWYGTPDEQKFADYAFVSPDLEVTHFEAPDEKISDHLPLILEFN